MSPQTTPQPATTYWYHVMGLCAAVLFSLPALAAPPSTAAVEKLLAVNGAQKSLERATATYETQIRQQVTASIAQANNGRPLTPQQQLAADKAIPGVVAVLRQEMSWNKLKSAFVKVYQAQLTSEQVDLLIKLYQNPTYVQATENMQTVNLQTTRLMLEQMPQILNKIKPVLEDAIQ